MNTITTNAISAPSIAPISAAMNLFWERGYVATSLSDLLARMKVSRKRIYSTYGSKEALFQAALQAYIKEQASPRMECLLGDSKGLGAIESYLKSWEFGPEFRGCLLWNSATESENLTPEAMQIVQGHFAQLETALVENLTLAKNRGELVHAAPAECMANQVLNTALGLSVMGKLVREPSASQAIVANLMTCLRTGQQQARPAAAC